MNLREFATLGALICASASSYGQTASLTTDTPAVSAGTVLTLTASADYASAPDAAGWSVALPAGWSFVDTSGPDTPQVVPDRGATGALEWAYATVPANGARFRFTVKTAGKPGPVQLAAKLYLRVDGKQQTVAVAPLRVTVRE